MSRLSENKASSDQAIGRKWQLGGREGQNEPSLMLVLSLTQHTDTELRRKK